MKRVLVGLIALAVFAGVAVVINLGWTRYERHRTFEPTTALDDQCDDVPDETKRVTLTGADGFTLGAALVGPKDANVGVVLRQGASQKICEWLPWAGQVAEATGARVLLFDRRGRGSSPGEGDLSKEPSDTQIAVDFLRGEGTPSVAVAASSMGNSIMFSALSDITPAPCAVLSISPVLVSGDSHGTVDGSALSDLPDNIWVTWEEGNPGVADNADRIVAQAGSQNRTVHTLAVDTDDHSRQLVLNHADVRDFLLDAIRSCPDPRPE